MCRSGSVHPPSTTECNAGGDADRPRQLEPMRATIRSRSRRKLHMPSHAKAAADPSNSDWPFGILGVRTTLVAEVVFHPALKTKSNRPFSQQFHACSQDRKSTRLNSSHSQISYAVFCLKKKSHSTSLS